MGMASSQARYLSLSARKTNTEYEGQQLNQQRVNIANQTADLFNQMLTMAVPVCPDSNDFTKIQYSYSDGINSYILGDFYQISVPNEEYNYVVSEYHNDNVYTGKSYNMTDPQIQAHKTNHFINYKEKDYLINQKIYNSEDDIYTLNLVRNNLETTSIFNAVSANDNADEVEMLDYLYNRTDTVYPAEFTYDSSDDTYTLYPTQDPDFGLYSAQQSSVKYTMVDLEDLEQKRNLLKSYGAKYDSSKTYYVSETGNSYFCKEDLETAEELSNRKIEIRMKDLESYYTDGKSYVKASDLVNSNLNDTITLRSAENAPTFSNYTAVGNCKLEALTAEEYNSNEDVQIEIKKIIEDVHKNYKTGSANPNGGGGSKWNPSPKPAPVPDIPDYNIPDDSPSVRPDAASEEDPQKDTDDSFSLSRGQQVTKTIKSGKSTQLTLTNPFNGTNYTYIVQTRGGAGDQSVNFNFLNNGRLMITGNNLQMKASNGQKDDIILKGNNNYIDTGDNDDIIRAGYVIDSNISSPSDNNTIIAGSGNDHIVYLGGGNYIDAGGGNDTIGYIYGNSEDYNNMVNGNIRPFYLQDGSTPDGNDGWANQGDANDCRLLALINSLVRNNNSGSLSRYITISQSGDGYNVSFNNYKGNQVDDAYPTNNYYRTNSNENTIHISNNELSAYKGVFGDKDVVLFDLAMNKLIAKNRDMGSTDVGYAYYNTVSNYLFGNDKLLYLDSGNMKSNGVNFEEKLGRLWDLYNNHTIDNLTVAFASGGDRSNGIITGHAYSVKNYVHTTDNKGYITLVNPWDDADELHINEATLKNMNMIAIVYGWTPDKNDPNYGDLSLQALYPTWANSDTTRMYVPQGGNGAKMVTASNDEIDAFIGNTNIDTAPPLVSNPATSSRGLTNCFSDTGEYIEGSIYKFKMFGKTYYTTATDLDEALLSALRKDATATNGIDSQHNSLSYYSSVYINTPIKESRRALIESDGKGRFSSVKFEDDSTVYTLNVETVTDEEAYRDAMNKYYYKQEQYDKAVAYINTKTKIIQAEDRELQLRLQQLGTEQTALQTEMEACQKVISKSIESTFKTFGG